MIFGRFHEGNVVQWMDDQSLGEETSDTYQDYGPTSGVAIGTLILTRAITFGDPYSVQDGVKRRVRV